MNYLKKLILIFNILLSNTLNATLENNLLKAIQDNNSDLVERYLDEGLRINFDYKDKEHINGRKVAEANLKKYSLLKKISNIKYTIPLLLILFRGYESPKEYLQSNECLVLLAISYIGLKIINRSLGGYLAAELKAKKIINLLERYNNLSKKHIYKD